MSLPMNNKGFASISHAHGLHDFRIIRCFVYDGRWVQNLLVGLQADTGI